MKLSVSFEIEDEDLRVIARAIDGPSGDGHREATEEELVRIIQDGGEWAIAEHIALGKSMEASG